MIFQNIGGTITSVVIEIIQQLGFPIFIGIALLWFLYKVWEYVVKKLDEKDAVIIQQINISNEHREKLIQSQNAIVETQRDIKNISSSQLDLSKELKDILLLKKGI